MPLLYFITHPDVDINPDKDVRQWGLSEKGKAKMKKILEAPWMANISALYSSTERKSIEAAQILADHLSLPVIRKEGLGEIDRTSTGYLLPAQFNKHVDEFFLRPSENINGWEKAVDAQERITEMFESIMHWEQQDFVICAHGGVGALALSMYKGTDISRGDDQPQNGGGNYFIMRTETRRVVKDWTTFE